MNIEEFANIVTDIFLDSMKKAMLEVGKKKREQITIDKKTVDRAKAFFEFEGFEEEVLEA